ncbi:MAG: fatty acyl-AMP ligase, partial [bacterium]|nr:fatty acyl-AMP ligase [bacterium]
PGSRRSLPRLRALVADSRPALGLTLAAHLDRYQSLATRVPELAALGWLEVDRVGDSPPERWIPPPPTGDTLAFLQYTSGSTAAPKGVMVSHRNLLHNQQAIRRATGLGKGDRVAGWLPLYHDMGLIGNVFQPLYLGIPCVLMPPLAFLQKPVRWLRAISRYRATTSAAPDFAYAMCVNRISAAERAELDLSCWRVALNGAEPVRAETLERFARTFAPCGFRAEAFFPCYGLAEATLLVTGGDPHRLPPTLILAEEELERGRARRAAPPAPRRRTLVSCGRPAADQRLAVVDPESARPVPPGNVGEIRIAGPSVARGYWNRPQETERIFGA